MKVYNNVIETIGDTPLVKLNKVCAEVPANVYAKLEYFNPGGSVKDRIGIKLVLDAEASGKLKPGGTIVEGTSGNTGMGLALMAITRGYKCIFTTNDKQSKEKVDILKAVGAEVIVCPTEVEPDDPRSYYSVAKRIAEETPNSFYVNQYFNLSNRQAHYEQTGPEIWEQMDGKITHFVVGVGTGGTISGCGKYLKEQNPDVQIWGVDSYGSLLKKYHETGEIDMNEVYSYITEGIGEDIIPSNINFDVIDHFEKVTDKDGAVYARRLAKEEGIFAGYSAGSAIAAIVQMKDQLKPTDNVVVLLHDSGSRYVGKVFNDEWMRERGFLEDQRPVTAGRIVENRGKRNILSVTPATSISDAFRLMKDHDLSQLPVMDSDQVVGSVSERLILDRMVDSKIGMDSSVREVMGEPFAYVNWNDDYREISRHINKSYSAVMVKDVIGQDHIITEFDLINAMSGNGH